MQVAPAPEPSSTSTAEMASSETEAPQHGRRTALRKSCLVTGHLSSSGTLTASRWSFFRSVARKKEVSSATIVTIEPSRSTKPEREASASAPSDGGGATFLSIDFGIPTGRMRWAGLSNLGSPLVGHAAMKWPGLPHLARASTMVGG